MINMLLKLLLIGLLLLLLEGSIIGCGSNSTQPSEPSNTDEHLLSVENSEEPVGRVPEFTFDEKFDTGDSCNSKIIEFPEYGKVHVDFTDGGTLNWLWGNVAKMWIYVDGKQVAYDVGRDVALNWNGIVNAHTKVEFKACAQTHGDSVTVECQGYYLRW